MLKKLMPGFVKQAIRDYVEGIVISKQKHDLPYLPSNPDQHSYCIGPKKRSGGKLPIPPRKLQHDYGTDDESYLFGGAEDIATMSRLLGETGFDARACSRALEFGCAAGRLIRHMIDSAPDAELFGVDISGEHIRWCVENLSPPIQFCHTTIVPHLPFEDRFFDLVFAGSIFTHVEDLQETWLHELGRVLRPGGRLYLTIHDEHTISILESYQQGNRGLPYKSWLNSIPAYCDNKNNFGMIVVARGPDSQVYYNSEYLRSIIPSCLKWHSLTPEAYALRQSALVLEKK